MPTPSPANEEQAAVLTELIEVAQKDAINSGNQSTVLAAQADKLQKLQELDQDRYDFWDAYINSYWQERRYIDGYYLTEPLNSQDFTNLLKGEGRLYSGDQLEVVRIPEFDYQGASAVDPTNEAVALPRESLHRLVLKNGFIDVPISDYVTITSISPGTTTVEVKHTSGANLPLPANLTRVLFQRTGVEAIPAYVTAIGPMVEVGLDDYKQTITIELPPGITFTTLPQSSLVLSAGFGFSNGERASKTASVSWKQATLNAYIYYYQQALNFWLSTLNPQKVAILGNTKEDQPDVNYNNAITALITDLTNYLTTMDVSDTGLLQNENRHDSRVVGGPNRITWIINRLTQTNAYNSRYDYSNLLYKKNDGIVFQISRIRGQADSLLTQQAASNARAATYSSLL